ncbi:MAG: hypothetical protein GF308_15130 [Candidatus Heimdallarchaeota archaeon]|nr:hypothetical protein [Candidatus Heimdallarchaeota archaeon]
MSTMSPDSETIINAEISLSELKIPTDSSKGTPEKEDPICAMWVFQNCGGDKEKKLKRIVSLVRKRNAIGWLPVTSDGKVCIVTYLGEFKNLIKLRSSVFGLGRESFSFVPKQFWVTPPQDISQFKEFFDRIQSDLQSREKRLLQEREMEIKAKAVKISPESFGEPESFELTEMDIEDLRKELNALSSI